MSTLPHNAPAANVEGPATVMTANECALDLDAAVRHFVATADGLGAPRPSLDELTTMIGQVAAITRELFPGKLVVETGVDPECRDDVCFLVEVQTDGSVEEIVALNHEWHRRLVSVVPQWPGLFCLMLDAR